MATQPVTPTSRPVVLPTSPNSSSVYMRTYEGDEISDEIMNHCAKLFSENYGVWGQSPPGQKGPKPGSRVKMTGRRLRQQCVTVPDQTVLVIYAKPNQNTDDPNEMELLGHAFATAWDFGTGKVGWVTQLVVSFAARKRYIATSLLQMLKSRPIFQGITAIGLVSSHPSACHVISKYAAASIQSADLTFCKENAKAILDASPVDYVRSMELRGSLFDDNCTSGAISSVFTNFYVDHDEPLEALGVYQSQGRWILGELLDGHEFLLILPIKSTTPTSSSSAPNVLH